MSLTYINHEKKERKKKVLSPNVFLPSPNECPATWISSGVVSGGIEQFFFVSPG